MKKKLITAFVFLISTAAVAEGDQSNELALIEMWLGAQRAYDNVPAVSAAIVHDQEVTWSGGFGYADIDARLKANADTIYGICSISKLFTGIAVMQLRDQGKLRLNDPLASLLPWFDLQQAHEGSPEITMRAVLTHSAGLPRESGFPYWMGPDFPFPTRQALKEKLGSQTTIYPADRYYQYSNLGLSLAGDVVSELSGQDYSAYVHQHILKPLGLQDTDTGFPADIRSARIATGYSYPGREQVLQEMPRYDARAITPAAGFTSTALDLARFATWQFRLLGGGATEVLNANTLREMHRVQWMDWNWGIARGLAFGVYRVNGRTLTGHAGDCPGFNTRLYLDPVSKTAVSVMANRNRVDVDGYAAAILQILEADATPQQDAPGNIALEDFVGSYDLSPWDGENLVFKWQDGLAVTSAPSMNPIDKLTRLAHVEGDRFHTLRDDDKAGHEIRFRRDEAGAVTHMLVHSLELPRL